MTSLVELQREVEGYRAEAAELADEYAQRQAEVAENPNLTPVGRRELMEPYHYEVVSQIGELHQREKAAVRSAKERLERRVFGLAPSASRDPARVVSYRDAQARARELEDSGDANEIYQSALRSGDNILATAVLEKALIRGWSRIKQDFLERNPTTATDLDDLAALAKYESNSLLNTAHYMPPSLSLPHSAGFPDTQLHKRADAPNNPVRPLADVMNERGGLSQ